MATRKVVGGYASQSAFTSLTRSNLRMIEIVRGLVYDYPVNLNARQVFLLGQLSVELASQGAAISELEKMRECSKRTPQTSPVEAG